ncbi:MAG TPA: hypothetical protein DD490_05030 [Acidobacteria bacterium]|nr:hypothetical protein [Acidobacteriota bacterium]
MSTIPHQNFTRLLSLLPDLATFEAGHYLRFEAGPAFMPLSIDVLFREGQSIRLAMAHNFKMNGDLVPDPDMELLVDCSAGTVEALTFQDQRAYREVYPRPGVVDQKLRDDLNAFISLWLGNIKAQGYQLVRNETPDEDN